MNSIKLKSYKRGTAAVKKYVNAVKGQHVVPSPDGWKIQKEGATKATKTCITQADAIEYAKKIAQAQKAELFMHGKDGRIRERNSYGNDPFPPK